MKQIRHTSLSRLAAVAMLSAALAACGGGGGGSSGTPTSNGGSTGTPAAQTQLSGKAIDGYMSGVTICFDNGQLACDNTLPQTTTDANGNYTLNITGDLTGKHILAVVQPGNVDTTSNTTFTQGFVLSAIVAGSAQNVTPITSLVAAQVAQGKSEADATSAVLAVTGASDVNSDYIAAGNTKVATFAAQTVTALQTYSGTSPTGATNVLNAVVASGSPSTVTAAQVAAQAATGPGATPVDASTALSQGLYSMEGYLSSTQSLSQFGLPNAVGVPVRDYWNSKGGLAITQDLNTAAGWVAAPQAGMFDSYLTGVGVTGILNYTASFGGGYVMQNDGTFSDYLSSDQMHPGYQVGFINGNVSGTDLLTQGAFTISMTQADVSGQPLASAVNQQASNNVRAAMTGNFGSGTTAYFATIKHADDQAVITTDGWGPAWVNGADAWNAGPIVNPDNAPTLAVLALGDTTKVATSVQQAVGASVDVSYNVQNRSCIALNILGGGIAQLAATNAAGCDYTGVSLPVVGSWSVYARNANVMTLSFPTSAATLDLAPTVKASIAAGGNLLVALQSGYLVMGYMLPASATQTYELLPAAQTDLIAAAEHAAAKAIGITLNP